MNVLNLHSSLHTNSRFTSLFFSLLDLTGLSSSGYGERMRSYRFSIDCVLMSVSSSDFSNDMDLLCGEDSGVFSGESTVDFSSSEIDSWPDDSIACFIEDERHFVPGHDYLSRFQTQSLDASAREDSVAWILKASYSLFLSLSLIKKKKTMLKYAAGKCIDAKIRRSNRLHAENIYCLNLCLFVMVYLTVLWFCLVTGTRVL